MYKKCNQSIYQFIYFCIYCFLGQVKCDLGTFLWDYIRPTYETLLAPAILVSNILCFFLNYLWSILGICLHQLIVIQVKKSMISLTLSLLKTTLTLNLVHVVPASWMSVWVWNYTLHRVIWDNVDPPYSSCH